MKNFNKLSDEEKIKTVEKFISTLPKEEQEKTRRAIYNIKN